MKELEALDVIEDTRYDLGILRDFDDAVSTLRKALTELEEFKRYPTSEEVCEALSEYYNKPCIYRDGYFLIKGLDCAENLYQKVYIDHLKRKPNLITLIGRFYEGLEAHNVR